jgi:uncharacterized ferritin-like protein (DUF455 family)
VSVWLVSGDPRELAFFHAKTAITRHDKTRAVQAQQKIMAGEVIPLDMIVRRSLEMPSSDHDIEKAPDGLRRRVIVGRDKFGSSPFTAHDRIVHVWKMILHSLLEIARYVSGNANRCLAPSHTIMEVASLYLPSDQPRARWKRLDAAQILKRFFFCERAVIVSASSWIPRLAGLELKMAVPRLCWQNAETANALRQRVFDLRFPSRLMEHEGADKPLADFLGLLRQAPSQRAFVEALANVALPALREAYREFLAYSDPLADAPTYRFLELTVREKRKQIADLHRYLTEVAGDGFGIDAVSREWVGDFDERLRMLGGIGTDRSPADRVVTPPPGSRSWAIPDKPARDARYWPCRFYWPDIIDSNFPYGTGLRLQLRSAVSHLNEVWAVEHGGIILNEFADVLSWEWIYDAARWTYDESRHCLMGKARLDAWGFAPGEVPLGSYIYESANGAASICRLGMLYFFETKNIGRKPERTAAFKEIGDAASEHDMDFDWADETIHATYGNRWLKSLHELNPDQYPAPNLVRQDCEKLVQIMIAKASNEEKRAITDCANALIQRAAVLAGG